MKIKRSDIWLDGCSYGDEVGDRVLYPAELSGDLYTISVIGEDDYQQVIYTLIADEDGAVIKVPFEDTLHVESQIELCKYQVESFETLQEYIADSRAFLEKFPI